MNSIEYLGLTSFKKSTYLPDSCNEQFRWLSKTILIRIWLVNINKCLTKKKN